MKNIATLLISLLAAAAFIFVLKGGAGHFPAIGDLLDPVEGLYYNARTAEHSPNTSWIIDGLKGEVQIVRDKRGVPHIFADHDLDAVTALGFAVAQDRLFQLDFIPRVAAGQLSEILGPSMISTDRFLRQTGMDWGARKNLTRIMQQDGVEKELLMAYVKGVNAYIDELAPKDYPLEFKLLGYRPVRYTPMHMIRLLQYMTFDLTYRTDDAIYRSLAEALDAGSFRELFPRHSQLYVPIIPETGGGISQEGPLSQMSEAASNFGRRFLDKRYSIQDALAGTPMEGFIDGKGSNNWAVGPGKSATGAPILAGDMHLSLWLPAIWYETHVVTPSMNTYGVTIPGAPLPVEAFNDRLGWAYTNTGSDQIDHMALTLNASGSHYLFDGEYREFSEVVDTLHVKGEESIVDTTRFAHWGPVIENEQGAYAIRWVAHEPSSTMKAQWGMNRARNFDEFQEALTYWDTPMQNILYADVDGNIAIRSTGFLPLRKAGHGSGLLDGSTDSFDWIGRAPFDELPHSLNPSQQYLTSTNQQPADSTYPHYLGHDWGPGYRSLRINDLLKSKDKHTVADLKRYQADVHAVQRDLFAPLLASIQGLSDKEEELRSLLLRWDGEATIDRPEPLVLDIYLKNLRRLVWDEPVFESLHSPNDAQLLGVLTGDLSAGWLDLQKTPEKEDAPGIMKQALNATVDSLQTRYGWDRTSWRWGENHHVVFRHFTRSEALKALWRGPYEYPGFASTLSPAAGRTTTHSASWRVVVDFSTDPPTGYGVYPGGQSGNPFSPHYDEHIQTFLQFDHYELFKPRSVEEIPPERISSVVRLTK